MMIDRQLVFSDKVALTGTGTTTSDSVDLGAGKTNIGRGRALRLKAVVNTTFTSGGAGTLQIAYVQSPDNATWTPLYTGSVMPLANLSAGASVADIVIPDNTQRYVAVQWTIGTAAMTAGAVTAAIVEVDDSAHYTGATNL